MPCGGKLEAGVIFRVKDDVVIEVIRIPKKFEQFVNIVLMARVEVKVSL